MTTFKNSFSRTRSALLVLAGVLGLHLTPAHALSVYPVSINTSAWIGTGGILAFDLIGGDSLAGNNTVTVSGFATDGVLTNHSTFSLSDVSFFNEELRSITFGSYLHFTLELTENASPPAFDQFSFFLLDEVSYLPLLGTTDPTGSAALFAIDITGAPGGSSAVFEPVSGQVSWDVRLSSPVGVPESGPAWMLGVCALGWLFLFRRRLFALAQADRE